MLLRCIHSSNAIPKLLAFLAMAMVAAAQDPIARPSGRPKASITIPRISRPPKLEEFLSMKPGPDVPLMADVENFVQLEPKDGAPAQEKTQVYIGYDEKNLYAVFICFDESPQKIRARMTRREDIGSEHDEVQLYLDTFNDERRSYGFMINPRGIQYDYIWTDSGGYDSSWDTVWDSSGRVTPQGYIAMMSIPFKSLRFPAAAQQTWGVLFQRVVPHVNDTSFFPRVSSSIQGRLSQEAELKGLENISPGRNLQLNPYVVGNAMRTLDARDPKRPFFTGKRLGGDAGLDAKLIVKDSLVLDVSVNPDFRQLESDLPQTTVNQRFELFFPEKRPFFQEGANYFDTPVNMYFTRRVVDPQLGVRLTGKLGSYGIGVMASDDQNPGRTVPDDDPLRRKRAYFIVGRLTRELWKQSQVGVFYSDREMSAMPNSLCSNNAPTTSDAVACVTNSNRVGGADFRFHFGDHWMVEGQTLASFTDQTSGTHLSGSLNHIDAQYTSRHFQYTGGYRDVSPGFITLMGFFQRPDIRRTTNELLYLFRPEGKVLTSWGPHIFQKLTYDHQGNRLDSINEPGLQVHLKQSTDVLLYAGEWHELLKPTDFSMLTRNTDFNKGGYWGTNVTSNYLKWMTFQVGLFTGKNINFDPRTDQAPFLAHESQIQLSTTLHPTNALTIANTYLLERLTARDSGASVLNSHIVRTNCNYQYSKELSFRAIVQYDSLLNNPLYTDLAKVKHLNADFLVSYLIHPGTAFYFGYNSDLENLDAFAITNRLGLVRVNRGFVNDGRGIFAKVSYLFRF